MFPGLLWGGSVSWVSNDAVLRDIFNDLRFRRAMSHAINREEFAEVFNLGLTEPRQAAPPADWSFYDETFGRKYLEYASTWPTNSSTRWACRGTPTAGTGCAPTASR